MAGDRRLRSVFDALNAEALEARIALGGLGGDALKAAVLRMSWFGYGPWEISEATGLSPKVIAGVLKQQTMDALESIKTDRTALAERFVMHAMAVHREAADGWVRSRRPCIETAKTASKIPLGKGGGRRRRGTQGPDPTLEEGVEQFLIEETVRTTETPERVGDPRFLRIMLDAQDRVAALLGLDAPRREKGDDFGDKIEVRVVYVDEPLPDEADG